MPFSTTAKHALRWLTGASVISDIDAGFQALAEDLDSKIAIDDQGSLAGRPTSTPGSPGKTGRYYFATDTGQLFRDNGTGWTEVQVGEIAKADLATDALNTFLKLALGADRKVNMGTGVTPSFAGNPGANGSFAHGLGVTPMWWGATFQQVTVGGIGRIIAYADNGRDATTINYTARTIDEAAIPGQVNFVWAAIG